MKIINRTPHTITIYGTGSIDDAPTCVLPAAPRQGIARVEQADSRGSTLTCGDDSVPVGSTTWGRIVGLPAEAETDVRHVVSVIVAEAARASGRSTSDLYVPGGQVRDSSGRIVGCCSLIPAAQALPRSLAADWTSAMRGMGATHLRGPVVLWSSLPVDHPRRLTNAGVVNEPGYPFTVWALGPCGIVGSIAVDSGQCPLAPHLVAGEELKRHWLAAGGVVDGIDVVLRPGERVVGTVAGRLTEGTVLDNARVTVLVLGERRRVLGSRIVPRDLWTDLRPVSSLGVDDLDGVRAP